MRRAVRRGMSDAACCATLTDMGRVYPVTAPRLSRGRLDSYPTNRALMRIEIPIVVVGLLALVLVLLGLNSAITQHDMLLRYEPVQGVVREAKSVSAGLLGGVRPQVRFEYNAGGQQWAGEDFEPIPSAGSVAWTDAVIEQLPIDRPTTVYVDPLDPSRAYLMPIVRVRPWLLIMAGVIVATVLVLVLRSGGMFDRPPNAMASGPTGWYVVEPTRTPIARSNELLLIGGLWLLLGFASIAHYVVLLSSAGGGWSMLSLLLLLYVVVCGLAVYRALSLRAATGRLAQPRLSATVNTMRLNRPVIVKIEQATVSQVQIKDSRVMLMCIERLGVTSRIWHHATEPVVGERTLASNSMIRQECTFDIPKQKARPASPYTRTRYPRTDWLIRWQITLASGQKIETDFALKMLADDVPQTDAPPQ